MSPSAQSLVDHTGQVQQLVSGTIDNSGDSFLSEFDWRPSGAGSSPGMGVTPGKTYYWRYGFIAEPAGTTLATAKITWGTVQSFAAPSAGLTCNGLAATVALYPLASGMTPLLLSSASTAIMVALAAWEVVDISRHPERFPAFGEHHE